MSDIKHMSDIPHGIIIISGITISILLLFSLVVHLHNVILSLSSVIFVTYVY